MMCRRYKGTLPGAFYPNRCISCGTVIEEEEWLCENCFTFLECVDASNRCLSCGADKRYCVCGRFLYHFRELVAPFYNSGVAQRALYNYKLGGRERSVEFFCRQMAFAVKNELRHRHFDGVCFVPASKASRRKRGFDQSELLARGIARILRLPLYEQALRCLKNSTKQHEMPMTDRFESVRGVYEATGNFTGQTLLLVDDIKTSGATLDECTRMLMFAGADHVCCVTALISDTRPLWEQEAMRVQRQLKQENEKEKTKWRQK